MRSEGWKGSEKRNKSKGGRRERGGRTERGEKVMKRERERERENGNQHAPSICFYTTLAVHTARL